eukprot:CCRYP_000585-RA/>CCRYP_000585-RA protein AED:0.09 eAED:0.09 QI:277/1/1/1/1/1/9/288/735
MIFPRQYSSLLWYVGLAALAQGALASLQPHRRRLSPSENIIAALDSHLANGIAHPHFTLVANYNDQEENLFVPAAPFEISVALTKSSVTEETSFSIDGGENFAVTSSVQFLISAEEGDAGLPPAFAILTIDRNANTVSGLVQKDGKLVKLEQVEGGETTVTEVNFVPPKDWTCNVVRDDEDGRRLQERHHAHDEHHHQHDISLDPLFDLNMLDPAMIQRRRKAYATDTFPNKWTFQVDLYIEVDDAFVNYHDPSNTANMPNTITYVNALITAISSIYEREVDTHLNVLHISKTSMYNTVGNVAQALQLMESTYGSSTNWHYTDPNGQPPDLHHAILYRSLGGGIAYLGTVCNSRLGFAVSSGVQGSLTDINNGALYWDINVIAHEVGHNFGADHTHEMNPIVDNCGNNNCISPVDGTTPISNGDGTLMSYCHARCGGGMANVAATFGGYWNEGLRSDTNSWVNHSPLFNYEPRRVPKVMYEYVSTRGTCVDPYLPIEIQTCTTNPDCKDGNSCTVDTCSSGQCSNVMQASCCGNFVCEAGESDCRDCGPFTVSTEVCSTCFSPTGMMFDVEVSSSITLSSLTFFAYSGTTNVTIYTAPGGYASKKYNSSAWTEIYSGSFSIADTWIFLEAYFSDVSVSAGSIQAFYIYSTGAHFASYPKTGATLASDSVLKVLNPSRATSGLFGSDYSSGLAWVGSLTYSINAPLPAPTMKPTRRIGKASKLITTKPTSPPTAST